MQALERAKSCNLECSKSCKPWNGASYASSLACTTPQALEEAGCFSLVLECVPAAVAAAVTSELSIPTIGIGAGPSTSGQVGRLSYWQGRLLYWQGRLLYWQGSCWPPLLPGPRFWAFVWEGRACV
jgi:hypothetical protein